jgi:hypothetical protein
MKSYLELDISVEGATRFDPKQCILANPEQPTPRCRTEMWVPGAGGVWYFDSDEIFNEAWLERADLGITGVFVFHRRAGYQHPSAHIDSYPQEGVLKPVCAGYNWVLDYDATAEMVWYEPWWDAEDKTQAELAAQGLIRHPTYSAECINSGTMYYQETPTEILVERERHSLRNDRITLCRTDIPHNVNAGTIDRWCMSLRTYPVLAHSWASVYNSF